MRNVVMLNRISLDGFFAGPNGEIDWFIHDPEVDKAAHGVGQADTVLFGRETYQMFERAWPPMLRDPNAPEPARRTAQELQQMTKMVFSRTLTSVTWENSKLLNASPAETVRQLKGVPGTPIIFFGSGSIARQLAAEGLIDDYLFIVTPVILGTGKALFERNARHTLELVSAQSFKSGNVLVRYRQA